MSARANRAAFAGVGHSRIFRHDDVPLAVLGMEAVRLAIADAGLAESDIDGICCVDGQPFDTEGTQWNGIDYLSADFVMERLGVMPTYCVNTANMLSRSVAEAISAVESGRCRHVVVFRALHSPRARYGVIQSSDATGIDQYSLPYGLFTPAVFAQLWTRYRDRYGSGSREEMARLVLQLRENGFRAPHSYWRQSGTKPPDLDEYLNARPVSLPLSIYDCDIPVQGAAAFIITTAERARDLRQPPAYVAGNVYPLATRFSRVEDIVLDREETWGRHVASTLWTQSGMRPADVDIANLYDGFSIIAILWLEALGFCGAGEGFSFIADDRIAPSGSLPINPTGGNLGCGRMHGVPQLMDSILQVAGRAGPCQIEGARSAVATLGPLWGGSALLLTREQH
ncbi:thiolase family protein [Sphingobium sp. V4]|uniref:thiolase family protein n=1 Tax=Sphingobium sp. V4 TaxID=3038927 RepID=UPI002557E8BC|nr:thiolase family protein [Sphingobium sp. V4]WIW89507.1 thiolase family protein [Sphingobium sp. V4]